MEQFIVVGVVLATVAFLVPVLSTERRDGRPLRVRAVAGARAAAGGLARGGSATGRGAIRGLRALGLGSLAVVRFVGRGVRDAGRLALGRGASGAEGARFGSGEEGPDEVADGGTVQAPFHPRELGGRRRLSVRFGQALEVTAPEPEVSAEPEQESLFTEPVHPGRAARSLAVVRLVLVLVLIGATIGVVFAGVAFEISRLTG